MATITLTLTDGDDDAVHAEIEFKPSLKKGDEATAAQEMALSILHLLNKVRDNDKAVH